MSWIDRLLGRESYNPELYDRVPCNIRGGRGVMIDSATPADPRYSSIKPRVRSCGMCQGKGHMLLRRPEQ